MNAPYIFLSGTTAAIVQMPQSTDPERWGEIQGAFCNLVQPGASFLEAWDGCFRLWESQKHGPVYWDHELAGPGGASFVVLPMPYSTCKDVEECVCHIRHSFDVVRLKVANITRWINFDPDVHVKVPDPDA